MKKLLLVIFITLVINLPVFAITPPYFGIFPSVQALTYIPESGNAKGATDIGVGYGIYAWK